jgi:hypothetical protein
MSCLFTALTRRCGGGPLPSRPSWTVMDRHEPFPFCGFLQHPSFSVFNTFETTWHYPTPGKRGSRSKLFRAHSVLACVRRKVIPILSTSLTTLAAKPGKDEKVLGSSSPCPVYFGPTHIVAWSEQHLFALRNHMREGSNNLRSQLRKHHHTSLKITTPSGVPRLLYGLLGIGFLHFTIALSIFIIQELL